ncbi:hypothetical protein [Baaleninema simplex]|nr:hypothetical protein [Baaleninema simplex]
MRDSLERFNWVHLNFVERPLRASTEASTVSAQPNRARRTSFGTSPY